MPASRLSSSLVPSLSCRHIKITSSQTWPKPYSKLQLPGGCSTVDSSPLWNIRKWASERSCKGGCQRRTAYQQCQIQRRERPSERSLCQGNRGMTITCCFGSSKLFWWGFVPDIIDCKVICTASCHPHEPVLVVKETKPQSMFYKDAFIHKATREDVWPVSTPWRPNSTAVNRSWRRRLHSSPELPWSCIVRTQRRKRRRHTLTHTHANTFTPRLVVSRVNDNDIALQQCHNVW